MAALRNVRSYRSNGLLATAGPAVEKAPTGWLLIGVHSGRYQRHQDPSIGFGCRGGSSVAQ